jgi:hypothetical protein
MSWNKEVPMKVNHIAVAVLIAVTLLLSAGGAALAAGKMGGVAGGIDASQSSVAGPDLAGGKAGVGDFV